MSRWRQMSLRVRLAFEHRVGRSRKAPISEPARERLPVYRRRNSPPAPGFLALATVCAESRRSLAKKAAEDTRFPRGRYLRPLHARLPKPRAFLDLLFLPDPPAPPDRTSSGEPQNRCCPGLRRVE